MAAHDPHGVARVLHQLVHETTAVLVASVILEPLGATERRERRATRVARRRAGAHVLLGEHGDVKLHLVIEAPLHWRASHEADESQADFTDRGASSANGHHPSPMRSTRSTARDIRAHVARSSASRLRPALVSL